MAEDEKNHIDVQCTAPVFMVNAIGFVAPTYNHVFCVVHYSTLTPFKVAEHSFRAVSGVV